MTSSSHERDHQDRPFKLFGDEVTVSSVSSVTVTCGGATCPEKVPVRTTSVDFVGALSTALTSSTSSTQGITAYSK